MKNARKNSIVLLIITSILLFILLRNNLLSVISLLFKINVFWLLVSIILIIIYWLVKTYSLFLIVKKYSDNIRLIDILKQTIIIQFFNGITPFSTGGQPMEMYMLNKKGLSLPISTSIILQNSLMYQISLVLYGLFAVVISQIDNRIILSPLIKKFVILGFVINTAVCIMLIILSFSKKVSKLLLKFLLLLGFKLKIIKNKKKYIQKYSLKLEEFHNSADEIKNNKILFIKEILLNLLSLTIFYSIPYFIIVGLFNDISLSLPIVIILSAYVLLIGSFVPIPGGTGGIEYGFLSFFGNYIVEPSLSALLIVWRFITYYLGIIVGAIMFNIYKGD